MHCTGGARLPHDGGHIELQSLFSAHQIGATLLRINRIADGKAMLETASLAENR